MPRAGTSNYEHFADRPGHARRGAEPRQPRSPAAPTTCSSSPATFSPGLPTPAAPTIYERALLNGILVTQDPADGDGDVLMCPMASGYFKTFGSPNDSFWCCTGTGVETIRQATATASTSTTRTSVSTSSSPGAATGRRRVDPASGDGFPESRVQRFVIRARKATRFTLHVRIPQWAAGASVSVNGKAACGGIQPAGFASIDRTWKNGDRVEVSLPMRLRLDRMPDDPNVAAVMYGPLVLAGELPTEALPHEKAPGPCHAEGTPAAAPDPRPAFRRPGRLDQAAYPGSLFDLPRPSARDRPDDVRLVPFHTLFGKALRSSIWHLGPAR